MIFIIMLLLIIAIIIANAMISKAIFDAEIKQLIEDIKNEFLKDK